MPRYNYNNTSYQDSCRLAEKLGDQKLRQWCIEQIGISVGPEGLNFDNVDRLFVYIKNREMPSAK